MLRLAFDFIIAWREIRARPNAYMQAVRHTDVSYKFTAIKVGLLSHTSRIYIDSLQQKQAILRLFEPYLAILLMRDTRFLVV